MRIADLQRRVTEFLVEAIVFVFIVWIAYFAVGFFAKQFFIEEFAVIEEHDSFIFTLRNFNVLQIDKAYIEERKRKNYGTVNTNVDQSSFGKNNPFRN